MDRYGDRIDANAYQKPYPTAKSTCPPRMVPLLNNVVHAPGPPTPPKLHPPSTTPLLVTMPQTVPLSLAHRLPNPRHRHGSCQPRRLSVSENIAHRSSFSTGNHIQRIDGASAQYIGKIGISALSNSGHSTTEPVLLQCLPIAARPGRRSKLSTSAPRYKKAKCEQASPTTLWTVRNRPLQARRKQRPCTGMWRK